MKSNFKSYSHARYLQEALWQPAIGSMYYREEPPSLLGIYINHTFDLEFNVKPSGRSH